jgi:hypothetical protein
MYDLDAAVDARLSATVSTFGHADCVRLAVAHLPHGASSETLERWATRFVAGAVPAGPDRWTTAVVRRRQRQLVSLARQPPDAVGMARPEAVAGALAERPGLGSDARAAVVSLTRGGRGLERLGHGGLLAQVGVVEAAQAAWESSGHRVAIVTRTARAARRWQALSGLGPPPALPGHATVIIVDNADRVPAADLYRHVADGAARRAKVVLVEGGTGPTPRRVAEPPFEQLRAILPATEPGPVAGPATVGVPAPVRGGLERSVAAAASTHDAIAALVGDWAQARAGPEPAVMLGLGQEEVAALNAAARHRLARDGVLHGPVARAEQQEWQAGDEVRVLRRHRLLGPAAAGATGTVTLVDPAAGTVTIRWPAGTTTVAAAELARAPARHAYAITPSALAGCAPGPVLCLGEPYDPPRNVGRRATLYVVAHAARGRDVPQWAALGGAVARRAAALGVAAEARPSRTVLAELGPPPATERERQAWRDAATAIEAFRDRWGLPDDPDVLALDSPGDGRQEGRSADRIRVLAACRGVVRQQRGQERTVAGGLELGR